MDRLWAPWRMEFILNENAKSGEGDGSSGCVLCGLRQMDDGPGNLILCRGALTYIVMNKYPYSNGHLMVVPHRHVGDFEELTEEEGSELFRMNQRCITVLRENMKTHGFNVGYNLGKAAGAGIEPHLHLHIVPRWEGDHNFMPVLSDVRVIPEHLEATYEALRKSFVKFALESKA